MKPARDEMKRYDGPVDVCIVGAGAAGSTLAKELAEGGLSVVVLEVGLWFDTEKDFVNDELAMLGPLDWDDPRLSDGTDPLQMGRVNTGRAIGGTTVHFTAIKLRLHREDFQAKSTHGIAHDWPLTYDDLEPHYQYAEDFVGVSGPDNFPWGPFSGPFTQGALPLAASDEMVAEGMEKMELRWCMSPHAVLTGTKDGRSPCMFYGFCANGCKSDAKGSALVTWVPAAVKAGAEFREECFVTRINLDEKGQARSVTYLQNSQEKEQAARIVIVSAYSIETPRLLLNSACSQFPDGLANHSGQVGRNLMVHPAAEVFGHFDDPLDPFVTPPVGIINEDFYGTRPENDFVGGFTINRYAHFPIAFITTLLAENPDLWGAKMFEVMDQYTHWAVLSTMNEMMPRPDNRVTLAKETDKNGVPIAHVTMNYDENDRKLLAAAHQKCEEILMAAGANRVLHTSNAVHVLGTCRMGTDPENSVVNEYCRSHDIENLYICDGSVFVTCGASNPSLTIEALALRTARHILEGKGS